MILNKCESNGLELWLEDLHRQELEMNEFWRFDKPKMSEVFYLGFFQSILRPLTNWIWCGWAIWKTGVTKLPLSSFMAELRGNLVCIGDLQGLQGLSMSYQSKNGEIRVIGLFSPYCNNSNNF